MSRLVFLISVVACTSAWSCGDSSDPLPGVDKQVDASLPRDASHGDASDRAQPDAGSDRAADAGEPGFCPGFTLPTAALALPRCDRQQDCVQTGLCVYEPYQGRDCLSYSAYGTCAGDSDCADAGRVCEQNDCGTRTCVAACAGDSCGPFARCTAGHCIAFPCDQPGYDCGPTNRCSPGEPNADAHGCVVLPCNTRDDCPCGSCLQGACIPHPAVCARIASDA